MRHPLGCLTGFALFPNAHIMQDWRLNYCPKKFYNLLQNGLSEVVTDELVLPGRILKKVSRQEVVNSIFDDCVGVSFKYPPKANKDKVSSVTILWSISVISTTKWWNTSYHILVPYKNLNYFSTAALFWVLAGKVKLFFPSSGYHFWSEGTRRTGQKSFCQLRL